MIKNVQQKQLFGYLTFNLPKLSPNRPNLILHFLNHSYSVRKFLIVL